MTGETIECGTKQAGCVCGARGVDINEKICGYGAGSGVRSIVIEGAEEQSG